MKAKDAVFLVWMGATDKPGRLRIVTLEKHRAQGKPKDCWGDLGAVYKGWRDMPPAKRMECVLWMGLEISEHYGVPIGSVMKEMEKIDEFIEHWNVVGKRACALF